MNAVRDGRWIVPALLMLLTGVLAAQENPIIYRIGIEQGLSNNSIRAIYQDHKGFMWFGTYDGLNRYDGYDFKTFRSKANDSLSLVHNYVNTITEDDHQNLWVGTGQGIGIYNNLTSRFSPAYFYKSGSKVKERVHFFINSLVTDPDGNMLIGTNGGGLLVKRKGIDIAEEVPCIKDSLGECGRDVHSIVTNIRKTTWLFVSGVGLCTYDNAKNKLQLVNNKVTSIHCMVAGDHGDFWIGAYDGLYHYDISSGVLTRRLFARPGMLTSNDIVSLDFDRNHRLWIGTDGGGLNIFEPATGTLKYISPGDAKTNLSSESVYAIYNDRESRKWIGTQKGGINIVDPLKTRFRIIAHNPLVSNSLAYNFVSSFLEDKDGNIWIGTDGGGLSTWNRSSNFFTNYRHEEGSPLGLSYNSVPDILEDHTGTIWIATFGKGINRFNKATQTFTHYSCINSQTGIENSYIWRLFEDDEQTLWATTYANGRLYYLNRSSNKFEMFSNEAADFFCITADRSGKLWGGSAFGLHEIDKANRRFLDYDITKPVRAIFEDSKKRLWLGTEGLGLLLFDRVKRSVTATYADDAGLCNNSVLNILEDDKGHLWLSTFNGLAEFDPEAKTFKNYYQDDGLQSNQFQYNAAIRLKSGEMAFGGIKGFSLFHPDSLKTRLRNPNVLLTGVRINNQPVLTGSSYIVNVQGDQLAAVKIPFDEAVLSFDFASLEYTAPGKIIYAYLLEGWDKTWTYSGKLRTANYTKLREGTYTLRIKATNSEGEWNPQEVHLKITVLPPWYRTWWAYACYILVLGAIIIVYQRYRINQAKLKYEVELSRMNALKERAELETERVTAGKEREINERRLGFFTNVSHEFRTPLTLIINPLKAIINKGKDHHEPVYDELNTVYRNARRMLSLVDQLMLFRKTEAGASQLTLSNINFYQLCRNVYLAFVPQAKLQNITYDFECENQELELFADREKMEIILYNLLSNAFKYTPNGGHIQIVIVETPGSIEVQVSDDGLGIPPSIGEKVFERFYQVQQKGKGSGPGFGIGLYMVKQFVESHHGTISFESNGAHGTTFYTVFPKAAAHAGNTQAIQSTEQPAETLLAKEWSGRHTLTESMQADRSVELNQLISDRRSLLVVDDDEQMLAYLVRIFSETYTVFKATTGDEGLRVAHEQVPDLIISDVKMPGITGIDFCKTIKKDAALSHIPVILLTGEYSAKSRLEGVEEGADDYIIKPFDQDLLIAKVFNLLQVRTNLRNYFYNVVTLGDNPAKISEEYKQFLQRCIAVVDKYLDDEKFSVKTLAAELNISHSNLYKKVKSVSGQSVNAFIRYIRLRKAAEIFINTNSNVNETALQVGFSSAKYFREQFAKLFGMKPTEYIKKYRKAFGKSYTLNDSAKKTE